MLKMTLNNLQLFAHKKGGGSTSNGRDSVSYTHLTLPTTPYV